jgi:hypothetical protein
LKNQKVIALQQKNYLQESEIRDYLCESILSLDYIIKDTIIVRLEFRKIEMLYNNQIIGMYLMKDNKQKFFIKYESIIVGLGQVSIGFIRSLIFF